MARRAAKAHRGRVASILQQTVVPWGSPREGPAYTPALLSSHAGAEAPPEAPGRGWHEAVVEFEIGC